MRRRSLLAVLLSLGVLGVLLALVAVPLFAKGVGTHAAGIGDSGVQPGQNNGQMNGNWQNNGGRQNAATTINGLNKISIVGSTQFIVDGQGKTLSVDANPYKVAIVPPGMPTSNNPGSLKAGDVLVTNIGGQDMGKTLVRFPNGMGFGRLFNATANGNTKGPADQAFNPMTGTDWVSNISGNNVQIFKSNGTVLATLKSPFFKKPWGMAFNNGIKNRKDGSVASFFVTNVVDATIDRIDSIPANGGSTLRIFQIGQLTRGDETKIAVTWIPSLQINGRLYSDVLLASDRVTNRIAAYPNSTTRNTSGMRSTDKGITVFQGMPLNMPDGIAINPINGDLLVVNLNDNKLVELNMMQGKVVGTRVLDNVPVDAQTGNGSALFGIAATKDVKGNLVVYFTDDNTNTLNVLKR